MSERFDDLEAVLRDLPRPTFKQELRESMEPQTITPYLSVRRAPELIEFVKQAFGAEELYRGTGSAGGVHCEVRVADSRIMIGGGEALTHADMPASLHFYVRDVDEAYQRAVEAGAKSLMPPTDQEYGDRDSALEDLAGNQWYLATSRGEAYKPRGLRAVTTYLRPRGADRLIDFMAGAFGATILERDVSPEGLVVHAKLKVGNSVVECGEARGPWPPMSTMIYFAVDDADAMYDRAIAAGAKAMTPPADQSYGPRVGAVEDPAGNQWYMAGPPKR